NILLKRRIEAQLAARLRPTPRRGPGSAEANERRGIGLLPVYYSDFMPKFFIKTYGCQMNERDSEQVAHSLIERGYERVNCETEADVILLNTCSVRDMAEQKALGKMGMLGRIARSRPETVFGFLGCMAQARGAELLKEIPH